MFLSERAEQHEVVVVIGKPRPHVLMLGERKGSSDRFVTGADLKLGWCRKGTEDGGRVSALLPNDDISIVGVGHHEPAFRLVR